MATVPFVLPTVVVGLAFRALLPAAWVGTLGAILVAHVFFNYAVVVRVVGSLWAHLDPRYEQAARTLGASPWRVLRTVTWPLLRPAVLAAAALVFLFTFTSFGVVLVLGGPTTVTLEVEIYQRTAQLLDLAGASALAVLQIAGLGLVLLVSASLQSRLAVGQKLRADPTETLVRPRRPGQRLLLAGVLATILVLLVAPMAALVLRSVRVDGGWGLDWWRALDSIDAGTTRYAPPLASLRVSLTYAVVTAVLAVLIGGLAAHGGGIRPAGRPAAGHRGHAAAGHVRGDRRVRPAHHVRAGAAGPARLLDHGPARSHADRRPAGAAHRAAGAAVGRPAAARRWPASLGAGPLRAWGTVDLPLLSRALGIAAGFAFAVSLGEFGATAFLARSDAPTLPVQIVRLLGRPGAQPYGAAMALATVLMVVTAVVMLSTERLRGGHAGQM